MSDYDYANARIRALKSQLFDRRMYAELAAHARIEDLIARLAQSSYESEIQTALARYAGARVVTEACRVHLATIFKKLRSFFTEDGLRLIEILLARWDLHNLITILRGQGAGAHPEEILEALVPAGQLDEAALRTLARQPDPVATADLLRTWNVAYASVVRNALYEYERMHDWNAFEAALDALFYRQLLRSLEKANENDEIVRKFLVREIDTINVLTALRLRSTGMEKGGEGVARHLITGGELADEWLVALARAARDEEALATLGASMFGATFAGMETFDMTRIQRALDRNLAQFGIAFFERDPLTIATAIGFITAKSVEVSNVRLIGQGIALGIERVEIERDLIL